MKIVITPEKEEKFEEVVYTNIFEFALTATRLRGDIIPDPINHTDGNPFILIGKLEELKERLRAFINGRDNPNKC